MSKFTPRWSNWYAAEDTFSENQLTEVRACKTCKSPSAGFAGSQEEGVEVSAGSADGPHADRSVLDRSRQEPAFERGELMDLATFARAHLVIRVQSTRLGRTVLFVSDNVAESALENETSPVYRASELRKLAVLRPEPHTLRCLHEVKSIFHGAITDVEKRDDFTEG